LRWQETASARAGDPAAVRQFRRQGWFGTGRGSGAGDLAAAKRLSIDDGFVGEAATVLSGAKARPHPLRPRLRPPADGPAVRLQPVRRGDRVSAWFAEPGFVILSIRGHAAMMVRPPNLNLSVRSQIDRFTFARNGLRRDGRG
jgi:hypothetical protein